MMKMMKIIWFLVFLGGLSLNAASKGNDKLSEYIASRATVLNTASDLDELVAAAAPRKLTLLGEASHGTHEYYIWRDSLSRRLIQEQDYRFIAVEGDWASIYELNRYVKDMPGAAASAREVLEGLNRWPLWMWGNEEVLGLAEWLRRHNDPLPADQKAGIYGMDVYDEWRSKVALLDFLETRHEEMYEQADHYLDCFNRFWGNSWAYAEAVARGLVPCTQAVYDLAGMMRERRHEMSDVSDYDYFYAMQNALVIKYAEKFYRKTITRQDAAAWNSRAGYMYLTVSRLLDLYGQDAKGIVWAHNTHIGDARFTDMVSFRQENIGQLSRLGLGEEEVLLVGFGSCSGTVKAAESWEAPMQKMRIPEAGRGSMENLMRQSGKDNFFILFDDNDRTHELFSRPLGHRAVGVTYNPHNDHRQFVRTIVPLRYDAFVFFSETEALRPLRP